jgi:hypothetical protein
MASYEPKPGAYDERLLAAAPAASRAAKQVRLPPVILPTRPLCNRGTRACTVPPYSELSMQEHWTLDS